LGQGWLELGIFDETGQAGAACEVCLHGTDARRVRQPWLTPKQVEPVTGTNGRPVAMRKQQEAGALMPWTPRRRELQEWFERTAPALGEVYAGAVLMLHEERVPGHRRIVAHAMREIGNRLPGIVGDEVRGRLQYTNRLDALQKKWVQWGPSRLSDGSWPSLPDTADHVAVDVRLIRMVVELIDDHAEARERPTERARRLFRAASDGEGPHPGLGPAVDQWVDLTRWAVSKTHIPSGPNPKDIDVAELRAKFELFEDTLVALLGTFYTTVEELDAILEAANA
jgi:hypothetical protein